MHAFFRSKRKFFSPKNQFWSGKWISEIFDVLTYCSVFEPSIFFEYIRQHPQVADLETLSSAAQETSHVKNVLNWERAQKKHLICIWIFRRRFELKVLTINSGLNLCTRSLRPFSRIFAGVFAASISIALINSPAEILPSGSVKRECAHSFCYIRRCIYSFCAGLILLSFSSVFRENKSASLQIGFAFFPIVSV